MISTPYTPTAPLDLGTLALSPDSTHFTASAAFRCIIVTDTTSGALPWTAQAIATPLTDTDPPAAPPVGGFTSINPENLGLTGLDTARSRFRSRQHYSTHASPWDVQSYSNTVATTDVPTAMPVAVPPSDGGSAGLGKDRQDVRYGVGGDGHVTLAGTLTLNAPSSTESGLYTGTITFTVSDGT